MCKTACIVSIIHLQLDLLGERGESWQLFNNPQSQQNVKGAAIQPKHRVKIVFARPGDLDKHSHFCEKCWGIFNDCKILVFTEKQ